MLSFPNVDGSWVQKPAGSSQIFWRSGDSDDEELADAVPAPHSELLSKNRPQPWNLEKNTGILCVLPKLCNSGTK